MEIQTGQHGPSGQIAAVLRILIVDDEPAILFAYRKLIEREGIAVDVCETFEDAIHHINTRAYFAVVADMRLTGTDNTDGLKVVEAITRIQPAARIILMTGYGNKDIEQRAAELGVCYYFEKPVMPAAILEALRSLGMVGQGGGHEKVDSFSNSGADHGLQ